MFTATAIHHITEAAQPPLPPQTPRREPELTRVGLQPNRDGRPRWRHCLEVRVMGRQGEGRDRAGPTDQRWLVGV